MVSEQAAPRAPKSAERIEGAITAGGGMFARCGRYGGPRFKIIMALSLDSMASATTCIELHYCKDVQWTLEGLRGLRVSKWNAEY